MNIVFLAFCLDEAGRPVNCELHNVMTQTKNQYHYLVRRVKNLADTIKSSKLSDAALSGNKQLLQEMKKVKPVHHKAAPDHVDAASGIKHNKYFCKRPQGSYSQLLKDYKEQLM